MGSPPVNTGKVDGYRQLQFESIAQVLSEVDRMVQAESRGELRAIGNWTAGQIFAHLAAWIEYGYDGYPVKSPPWPIRMVLKLMLRKYLSKGMPRGVKIPGVPDGTTGMDAMGTEEAAKRLKAAFSRLEKGEACPHDSPAFGKMSHEDRIRLNLRHAELHLGYLIYG